VAGAGGAASVAGARSPHPAAATTAIAIRFRDLWRIAPDGSGLRRMTRNREGNFDPDVSPDGRSIASPAAATETRRCTCAPTAPASGA
jgi:Tol biopolymer transport system component